MTVNGNIVDLSSNNGDPSKWAWATMKSAGVIAVIAKATQGTTYTNEWFAAARSAARSVGLPFAAYHFANFTDPAAEARYFISVAGPDAKILDSETSTDAAWQNQFLIDLGKAANQEMDYGSASTLPRTGVRSFLWPASYGKNYGFGEMWQDTDKLTVPGCPVALDASVWLGSQADFDTFFGSATTTTTGAAIDMSNFPGAVAATATPDGGGAWVVTANGNVYTAGTAQEYGTLTTAGVKGVTDIVGIASSKSGRGYFLWGSDGGVFAFGDAKEVGSYPGLTPAQREGERSFGGGSFELLASGTGYRLTALDGARYVFGT